MSGHRAISDVAEQQPAVRSKRSRRKAIALGELDNQLLVHLRRHRMTTIPVLIRVLDETEQGVRNRVRRLTRAGYVRQADLGPRQTYVYLTPWAVQQFGDHEKTARPLGEQALFTRYGILLFCCGAETDPAERRKLTRDEFAEAFPDLQVRGAARDFYYVDRADGRVRLGIVLTDHGAAPRRLLRKVKKTIDVRYRNRHWRDLFLRAERGFVIGVACGAQTKADRLQDELDEIWRRTELNVAFRVEAFEPLMTLLGAA